MADGSQFPAPAEEITSPEIVSRMVFQIPGMRIAIGGKAPFRALAYDADDVEYRVAKPRVCYFPPGKRRREPD